MSELLELKLASIEVGTDRAREIDPAWVEGLAGSIREQGLMQPITVYADDDGYHLIAGHHRLEAFRLLGRETIPAMMQGAMTADEAKLAEVMENLCRNELIALDRCRHLFDLKQVWERLHPETAHGKASPKSQDLALSSEAGEIFGFARATAEKIGLGLSTIKADVKIWTGLAPAVRIRLVGTDTATKRTELKALSELPVNKQVKVLDAIQNDDLPEIGNVAQALEYLQGGSAPSGIDKQFRAVSTAFGKLADPALDMVVSNHADRVIASLKRMGRI